MSREVTGDAPAADTTVRTALLDVALADRGPGTPGSRGAVRRVASVLLSGPVLVALVVVLAGAVVLTHPWDAGHPPRTGPRPGGPARPLVPGVRGVDDPATDPVTGVPDGAGDGWAEVSGQTIDGDLPVVAAVLPRSVPADPALLPVRVVLMETDGVARTVTGLELTGLGPVSPGRSVRFPLTLPARGRLAVDVVVRTDCHVRAGSARAHLVVDTTAGREAVGLAQEVAGGQVLRAACPDPVAGLHVSVVAVRSSAGGLLVRLVDDGSVAATVRPRAAGSVPGLPLRLRPGDSAVVRLRPGTGPCVAWQAVSGRHVVDVPTLPSGVSPEVTSGVCPPPGSTP